MLKGLKGRTVLVTGAGGGIGKTTCERLLLEGANVLAADLDISGLELMACDRLAAVSADISTAEGVQACIDAAVAHFGGLESALLNAGVECKAASVADFSEQEYERVFDVNVRGSFLCARAVVRHLLEAGRPGGIVFVSSIAGLKGSPTTSVYNASKHAVVGLAKSLALEVGAMGIRVNTLCPGVVDTRMMRSLEQSMGAAAGTSAEEIKGLMESANPLGRYATVGEIAAMAVWILSDEAPYCHGETLTIGGGLMA